MWAGQGRFKARLFVSPPVVVLGAVQLELECKEKLMPGSPDCSVMVRAGVWRFAFISLPPHLGDGWCQREGVFIRMNCFQIFPAHLLPIVVQQEMQEPAHLWICLFKEIADLKPAGRDSPAAHSRQG